MLCRKAYQTVEEPLSAECQTQVGVSVGALLVWLLTTVFQTELLGPADSAAAERMRRSAHVAGQPQMPQTAGLLMKAVELALANSPRPQTDLNLD